MEGDKEQWKEENAKETEEEKMSKPVATSSGVAVTLIRLRFFFYFFSYFVDFCVSMNM